VFDFSRLPPVTMMDECAIHERFQKSVVPNAGHSSHRTNSREILHSDLSKLLQTADPEFAQELIEMVYRSVQS
jgi:hypothetical protein